MPGMSRRVFLHVGTPKSGTSYLQDKLTANADGLSHQGIGYARTRDGDHFEAALDLIEKPWAGQLELARGQWDALAARTVATDDDGVISHEILAAAKPAQVARAVASFPDREVHVIVTARDLARQIPAEWQEKIKHRGWVSFADFSRRVTSSRRTPPSTWFWRVQDLRGVLQRWSTAVPAERLHLVTLPPRGAPADTLWNRFGSVLGVDPGAPYAESTVANASLGIAEIRTLRRLNFMLHEAGVTRDTYVDLVREHLVRNVLAVRQDKRTPQCSPALRSFVEEVTGSWTEWIRASGIDVVGHLYDLTPEFVEENDWVDPDSPDPKAVADAALDALAAAVIHADTRAAAEPLLAVPVPIPASRLRAIRARLRRP